MSGGLPRDEIRIYAGRREWRAIVDRLADEPVETLLEHPEIGFLFADACWRVGQPDRTLEIAGRLEARVRRSGDRTLALRVENVLGITLFQLGRTAEAEERFARLLEDARVWGNEEFAARAANNLGVLANVRGKKEEALGWYRHSLAAYYRLGYARGLAQTHHNLGISYHQLMMLPEAESHCQKALEFALESDSEDVVALAEVELASIYADTDDGRLAEPLASRGLRRHEALHSPLGQAEALRVLAGAARARGESDLALERLAAAEALADEHRELHLLDEISRDRAELLRSLGDTKGARDSYAAAADSFARFGAAGDAREMEERRHGHGVSRS